MRSKFFSQDRTQRALASCCCAWLPFSLLLGTAALFASIPKCCCHGGDACLIAGCECLRNWADPKEGFGCLRSSLRSEPEATTEPLALDPGFLAPVPSVATLTSSDGPAGRSEAMPPIPARSPEKPPPRSDAV